ncbi:hypothetical protein NAC44_19715 [Allorhizobium sp. BGMRC 0089]|uniref:plant virulence effector HPE1-like domain-containing protein n=1 Tax=Allorhizobium sonneratiae TaxID=2934936 RepID=UPI002033AC3D|nr:plant virulence effector HPE1-like domain-containing protein [Allorhizobium sonneratiae]MCM2294560.1 hypothetical protein [Allorhizobium sonneratiae]
MRMFLAAALVLCASGAAQASSIVEIKTDSRITPSVVKITCASCTSPVQKEAKAEPATGFTGQSITIKTVNGRREIIRTADWMGGSPVTYINKADGWLGQHDSDLAGLKGDGIDLSATTAAVETPADHGPAMLPPPGNNHDQVIAEIPPMQLRLK